MMEAAMKSQAKLTAAGLLLLVMPFGAELFGQDTPFALKVNVAQIPLDVTVHDSGDNPVSTLTRDDFLVFENDVPQDIQYFEATAAPYHVLLLFDISGSTTQRFPFMLEAANRFLANLRSQDQVALASFDVKVTRLVEWRTARGQSQQVPISPMNGGTDLYGALLWAAQEMSQMTGRKGVIVLTDGIDRRLAAVRPAMNEGRDFQHVLDAMARSRSQVYFVAINTDLNPDFPGRSPAALPRQRMEKLAQHSGGRVLFPKTIEDVAPLYVEIAKQFGASYSLAYGSTRPSPDGTYRRIDVRLKGAAPGLRIAQSRAGYYAGGSLESGHSAPASNMKTSAAPAPVLITPIEQALLSPPDREEWRFTWEGIPNAARYQIVVNAPGVSAPIVDAQTRSPRYALAKKPLPQTGQAGPPPQGWIWKVRAQSSDGAWGPWSDSRPFDVFVQGIVSVR
jgi:VWFA-related protein